MNKSKRDVCFREEDALCDLLVSERSVLRRYVAALESCPSEETRALLAKLLSFAVQDMNTLREEFCRRFPEKQEGQVSAKDLIGELREKRKELFREPSEEN